MREDGSVRYLEEVEEPLPGLKLKRDSRTFLRRFSSSITNVPQSARELFGIKRKAQPRAPSTLVPLEMVYEEKGNFNFIFNLFDLKKHREANPANRNVTLGMGIIFRRENRRRKRDGRVIYNLQ